MKKEQKNEEIMKFCQCICSLSNKTNKYTSARKLLNDIKFWTIGQGIDSEILDDYYRKLKIKNGKYER